MVFSTVRFTVIPVYVKGLDGKNVLGEDGKPQLDYGENDVREAIRITIQSAV